MKKRTSNSRKRVERNRVLIVCGGHTEKYYFDKLKEKSLFLIRSIKVKKVSDEKTDPVCVVCEAIRHKDNYDYTYAVFDKDSFSNFDEAIRLAKQNNIVPMFSNQAFELWIYFHFGDFFCGNMHRDKLVDLIENFIKTQKGIVDKRYRKSDLSNIWSIIEPNINKAIENSKKSHQKFNKLSAEDTAYKHESSWESSTNLYILMERIFK